MVREVAAAVVLVVMAGCGSSPRVTVRPGASWRPMPQAMADRLMEQANAPGGAEWITEGEMDENEEETDADLQGNDQ